jgi:hypothetical protein
MKCSRLTVLVAIEPVRFGAGVATFLDAPLRHAASTQSGTQASSGPRPLKWTHKSPLLAALGKLDLGARRGNSDLVSEVRRRVKKLDKLASASEFLDARELADVFPRAALCVADDCDAADGASAVPIGQHFLHAAQLHQLLVTCRLVKHTALVSPDHSSVPDLLLLLQTLLERTDSPLLRKSAKRIDDWLAALPPLQTAPPLTSAELAGATSRFSLDWRPLSGMALRQQGATAARLLLSDEQRERVVGVADRLEKSVDSLTTASTHKRFSAVVRFFQGGKKQEPEQPQK